MGLPTAYLITTKNLESFLNAIKTAKAPESVNNKFLANLEFTSSNDRLLIGVLKALSFADDAGVPTKRYFEFLDQTRSGVVLAEAIREAYSDLFAINTKAQDLSLEDVKNKLRTLTQGQNSEHVLGLMAKTFRALSDLADWKTPPVPSGSHADSKKDPVKEKVLATEATLATEMHGHLKLRELHYNIQVVLPETRDIAVFDAIFDSLRKHLL
jgi:hypothetical protein